MILGTAGHIDHGKTALVKALTGVDADRLPEEKRRGITIDLGFAPLELDGVGTIGVVDVPGHEGFIRTMLAGASGIDLAMLVVAADEGVMPQTREHLEILSLLQIPRGVIALTKSDLVDDDWRQLVAEDVRALCASSLLNDAEIVEVSSVTLANIDMLKHAIGRVAREAKHDRANDLFRLPVDRAFTVTGTGTVITGTVWSGSAEKDQVVRIEPGGKTARIRAIQSHGHAVDRALPGTRTALALAGCDVEDVARGSTIVQDARWVASSELDVALKFTDDSITPTPRTRVHVHIGTSDSEARLSRLRRGNDGQLYARLILDDPMIARGRDRFVIRMASPARTIGGGEVIDPYPSRRRNGNAGIDMPVTSTDDRLRSILASAGPQGVDTSLLPIRLGEKPAEVTQLLARAGAITVGTIAVSPQAVGELENVLVSFTSVYVANHPLEPGVSLQTLRRAAKANSDVIEFALARLEKKGRIELSGSIVRPAGWQSRLDENEQAVSDSILHDICIAATEPPSVGDLEQKYGRNTSGLLRRLERAGQIQKVADDRYYGSESVSKMVGTLRSRLVPGRKYTPAELKEVLGGTRKYLIPFLEFCDRTGVTERGADGRQLKKWQ